MFQHDLQRSGRSPNDALTQIKNSRNLIAPNECCGPYVELNDTVYMASPLTKQKVGYLFAMNSNTNKVVWKYTIDNDKCSPWLFKQPIIDINTRLIYAVANCAGDKTPLTTAIVVLDLNGNPKSTHFLFSGEIYSFILTGDLLWVNNYVNKTTTTLYALSKDDMKIILKRNIVTDFRLETKVEFFTFNDKVVYYCYGTEMNALAINGTELWSYSLPVGYKFYGGFAASNNYNTIYALSRYSYFSHFHAFDANYGDQIWVYSNVYEPTFISALPPAIDHEENIFWATGRRTIVLNNRGKYIWTYTSQNHTDYIYSSPVLARNDVVLVVYGKPGGILALHRKEGELFWEFWDKENSYIWETPYIDSGKRVIFWAKGGTVNFRYCYEDTDIHKC